MVIRSSAIGDVAMTVPVLTEVAEQYPETEMVVLTKEFCRPFFERIPNLTIYPIDFHGRHKGLAGLFRLYRELKEAYPGIEMVLDLHDKIYSKVLQFLYRCGGVKTFRIDKGRKAKKELTRKKNKVVKQLETTIERYANVFRDAGMELPEISRDLAFYKIAYGTGRPVPPQLGIEKKAEHWLGIAPFATYVGKIYPLDKLEQVIAQVVERDPSIRIFLFGGGAEEKRQAESLAAKFDKNAISVIGRFGLKEEMDLIANLDVMVAMDSSAMHMASLLGLPVVSIWGATHPAAGFLGVGQSPEDVIQVDLDCRPCSVYGHKLCWYKAGSPEYYACLNRIEPERIVERIWTHLTE